VIVERFRADYQIQSIDQLGYPATVTAEARQVDGVSLVSAAKVARAGVDGEPRTLFAVEPSSLADVLELELLAGDLAGMADGGVVVSEEVGVAVGGEVELVLGGAPVRRQVVGVMDDLHLPGTTRVGQVLMSTDQAGDALAGQPDLVSFVRLDPGAEAAAVRGALEQVVAAQPDARLADTAELRAQVSDQTNRLLGLVVGLVLLSVVVAFVGVVNILGLSVAERSAELGLLQALGMTPHQAREMVRWESVIITVLGTTVGVTLGLLFGWLGVRVLRDEGLEVFSVPVEQIALAVVVMLVAGVAASVLPARRASTVDVLHAVTLE
jgi:putative ABC transport system permease protein